MKVELKNLHTIVAFIGISGSGKSSKAMQLNELARSKGLKSAVLSSDECRQELLLSDTCHHNDVEMYHVSDKAFELLEKKIELYLKWPYNLNLVILDMMNLKMEDRQKIVDLARVYCYDLIGIVMDYSNIDDYLLGLNERYDKRLLVSQLRRFRTDTLPTLGKNLYDDLIRAKSKTESIELECKFPALTNLPGDEHYFIVPDIHECIESFKALLRKAGFRIEKNDKGTEMIVGREDTAIIIDGDLIDKGLKTKETIEFVYNNMDRMYFVWGGHENFVNKWLNGKIKDKSSVDSMEYYTSIPVLEKDEELRRKFFAICDRMKPFYQGKYFIVTHAGCESKFLGKTQNIALRAQRYYHVDRFEDSIDDEIWLINRREALKYMVDSQSCWPLHIFGHEAWRNNLIYKNRIGIDTGCVLGGRLSGIEIRNTGDYKLYNVNCLDDVTIKEKLREFRFEEPRIKLEDRDYYRLKTCARNKVNFVSGTMCPADKRGEELEDINQALDYYKNKGIDKVMLQIKYMGSRCNIYLFDDIEKSYAITRNGFLVKLDLTNIYKKLKDRLSCYFNKNELEMMIIDGELMPWSALGQDLIGSTFQAINKGVHSELDLLKNNGFEEQLAKLKKEFQESEFGADKCAMKKEDLYSKYGPQKYEAFKLLSDFYIPDVDELEKLHGLYNKQLDIYAKPFNSEDLSFEAFSILKSVKKDGEELLYFDSNNELLFKTVNDTEYAICDLTPEGYNRARSFFDRVTNQLNLEGIVIKPLKVDSGWAPFIKVRSPNYLTIIYGYDYLNKIKYHNLIDQKRIKRKLETSIKEWQLGKKLLTIPYKEISENNEKYMDLMSKMIIETNSEENIDPRL